MSAPMPTKLVPAALRPKLRGLRYTAAEHVMHELPHLYGGPLTALVVGDDGAYEWVLLRDRDVLAHSDDGYGSPDVALRDVLIAALGMPQQGLARLLEVGERL
jgi:hypothetical protein